MSDLPRDLVEEILSKLPFTCMRAVRLTCKNWNTLSKTPSFMEKHIGEETSRECRVIMMMDNEVSLIGVNFSGIHNKVNPSIEHTGKLIMRYNNSTNSKLVDELFHCDGLLLFVMNDRKQRLLVWNPYCGQHKWIQPISYNRKWEAYAMGYEKKDKSRSHKILRIMDENIGPNNIGPYEMYDFKSDSWKVLAIKTPLEGDIIFRGNALSLKGDAYWVASEKQGGPMEKKKFLIGFDFTKERLGPRLSLPHGTYYRDVVILASGREREIALLFHKGGTSEMEIWVTTKITPNTISWSKSLAVDMRPFITGYSWFFNYSRRNFIDEEKKVVVVISKDENRTRNVAYIIGEDGYFRKVDLGEVRSNYYWPLVCSYVPSSAHISSSFLLT
ncbi:hypothetical protein Bca52824_068858 [Brassica carinata]|uniref:F-box domain-containing protein n=1 Tax=Brassica carinata TaxID=52824 RepID=A0A8X7U1M4_BRACI|nr:hypothetical protein Bca52824_068858 [Brassica carinata]